MLLVELPRDMVDVNVHPAKTIVKFVGEKRVFDLVYHAVMAALDKREEARAPPAEARVSSAESARRFLPPT